jgi:drug/metabolite transporter (DMT)-like permease
MPFGLLAGLGAALAWGTMDVGSALASRRLGSLVVTAGGQAVSAMLLVIAVVVTGTRLPSDQGVILLSGLLGAAGAGAYLSYFTGLRIGPIAVVSGMVAAYGGLTVVLAVVVRGETLTPLQAIGAALATAGVIATGVAFDGGWRRTRFAGPGVVFAVIALVLFALMTVGLAVAIENTGWLEVIALSRIVNAALTLGALAIVLGSRYRGFRAVMDAPLPATRAAWAVVGFSGVLDVAGMVSLAVGLERAPTWLVGLASSFGPAVTIIVAVAMLGERLRPVQWVGLSGVGLGLVAIALP